MTNAQWLIICHNHPSGNIQPSESDKQITQKIKEAAGLLDVQLMDHLIIASNDDYFSFADIGLLKIYNKLGNTIINLIQQKHVLN